MNTDSNVMDELTNLLERARRNTLGDILARTRDRMPEKFALAYRDKRLNYEELDDLVNQTAFVFRENGMKKGDMITVMSKNSLDFVVVNFALARIGAVMIPINYMLTKDDVRFILQHAGVRGFIASEEYAPVLDLAGEGMQIDFRYLMDLEEADYPDERLVDWTPLRDVTVDKPTEFVDTALADDDLAHVLYTSGTESRPKGVMLTHKSIISEYMSCIVDGNMTEEDVIIHPLPMYHSAQLHCFLGQVFI